MKKIFSLFGSLLFCVLSFGQPITAQQAAADFRQVNLAYQQVKTLSMNVNYSLFPSYTSTTAYENEKGVYLKQGDNYYSYLLGIVSLSNSKVSLTLDSNEQTIVVTDPLTQSQRNPSLVNLDSLLLVCNSFESKDAGGGLQLYKLKFDQTPFFEYNEIDVYINNRTHFIERMIIFFRAEMDLNEDDGVMLKEKPRLEIRYSDISTSPVFTAGQFSESRYIRISGKNITCASSYSSFRLINHKLK